MKVEIVFVMVGTTHTGNLGAAARAMKTMGFTQMRLVDTCAHLSDEALARSSGANDVLQKSQLHDTLQSAIADCRVVVGTSARARQLAVPLLSCRGIADELAAQASGVLAGQKVAIVFGHERSGLSNESLDLCTRLLRIPCNPEFSSLNLGSAVQVVAYELSQALMSVPLGAPVPQPGKWRGSTDIDDAEGVTVDPDELPATSDAMEHFFEHLERIMIQTGFLNPEHPRLLRRRIRRYFERNRPTVNEMAILRGILSSVEKPRPR